MRVLLDECIDERFRKSFPGHECQTARYARLAGLRNGQLLTAAEIAGFDVIVTVDQNMFYQQNFATRRIALLTLTARTNRRRDLEPLLSAALAALATIKPGEVIRIGQNL